MFTFPVSYKPKFLIHIYQSRFYFSTSSIFSGSNKHFLNCSSWSLLLHLNYFPSWFNPKKFGPFKAIHSLNNERAEIISEHMFLEAFLAGLHRLWNKLPVLANSDLAAVVCAPCERTDSGTKWVCFFQTEGGNGKSTGWGLILSQTSCIVVKFSELT